MSAIIPTAKPKLGVDKVDDLLNDSEELRVCRLAGVSAVLLGVRGYRRDTMGRPGVNDCGIYDDAIFLRWPGGFLAFNANTDPALIGWNAALGKPFAQLKTGLWPFVRGLHKGQYLALRQPYEDQAEALHLANVFGPNDPRNAGHFTVIRDDGRGHRHEENAYQAINIHRGGNTGTSSWGCQTIPPGEYMDFIEAVCHQMKQAKQSWIPYLLIDGPVC